MDPHRRVLEERRRVLVLAQVLVRARRLGRGLLPLLVLLLDLGVAVPLLGRVEARDLGAHEVLERLDPLHGIEELAQRGARRVPAPGRSVVVRLLADGR